MEKHVIVVSVDALVYEDLENTAGLPVFDKMMKEGARINRVTTIYPALTHPIHATMMTGCTAGKTGIVSNELFEAGQTERPWYNHLPEVQCDTIFHAAHRAGLKTAACRWPVTANGGDVIDYLIPETMGTDEKGHEDDPLGVYKKLGTSECCMPIVEEAVSRFGFTHEHPFYDDFEIFCACEIIKKYQPNLLMTHPGLVDAERHRTGLFSPYVRKAVEKTEEYLEQLLAAVKEAGIEDSTDFIVLSDHGHLNIERTICPNVFLKDAGLIRTDTEGKITSWDAFTASCGLSGQVYLSDPSDPALKARVYSLLRDMAEEGIYGFERVFTAEEVKERYGLYGDFSFVIETDGFTSFSEAWERPVVRPIDISDYRLGHSTHGHMPEKGPQPPLLAMGPSIRSGFVQESGSILGHAPTFAKILEITLPEAQGQAHDALLL